VTPVRPRIVWIIDESIRRPAVSTSCHSPCPSCGLSDVKTDHDVCDACEDAVSREYELRTEFQPER
jgi:hypothetical protein